MADTREKIRVDAEYSVVSVDDIVDHARYSVQPKFNGDPPYEHIQDLLQHMQRGDTTQTALTFYKSGNKLSQISYEQLLTSIAELQISFIKKYPIIFGKRIAILSYNSPSFVISALALMSVNAIVVPLNPAESKSNLKYTVSQSGTCMLLHSQNLTELAQDIVDDNSDITLRLVTEVIISEKNINLIATKEKNKSTPAVLMYTSGTTGNPKGVLLSHDALLFNAFGMMSNFKINKHSRHLCVLPLYHANAWGFSMLANYMGRGHLVLCDKFQLLFFWKIVDQEKINLTSLTPVLLKLLSSYAGKKQITGLTVVSAASPLKKEIARQFENMTGLRVNQGYGLSECTNFATIMPPNLSSEDFQFLMYGFSDTCIGSALLGTEVKVVDKQGNFLGPDENGQLVVRGINNMLGYWKEPDKTREVYARKWLHTGDQGYCKKLNGKDYFFISGRFKEIIIRLGENISPSNIESQLRFLNVIGECIVVGFENDYTDEEIGLWIEPKNNVVSNSVLIEELIHLIISRKLPFFQQPKVVFIGPLGDVRTSVGKIKRSLLRGKFSFYQNNLFKQNYPPIIKWKFPI